jgi:ACS family hexuronate transporter-like MFS transporter
MALFVCFWSISQMLHGLAGGKWSFAACRFGLGLAEPGSFPAAVKAIGEWFPAKQRALGVGIFNAGSSLGAAVASPLVATLALHFGWRAAFVVTGILGIIWLIGWLVIYDSPRQNRWLSDQEAVEFKKAATTVEEPVQKTNWWEVVSSRSGLMVMIPRFLTDPVIFFVIFGLPDYLEKDRGFNLVMIRNYGWIPFAFGGMGYLIGGWLSGQMIAAGWGIGKARKTVMAIGAAFLPVAILAPFVPSAGMAIAAMSVVVFGHAIWVTNLMALPTDLFPSRSVASAAGFSGMGGAIGGALASGFIGIIVSHISYVPIFICAGLLHPLSALLVWMFLPERYFRPLPRAS